MKEIHPVGNDQIKQDAEKIIEIILNKDQNGINDLSKLINEQNILYKSKLGFTFLHYATRCSNTWATKLLIDKQKEIAPEKFREFIDRQDELGRTALGVATILIHKEIFEILLSAGANPNISDHYGRTSVHDSTINLEMFKLLEPKADLSKTDKDGCTIMHIAAANVFRGSGWAVVKYLLELPEIKYNQKNNDGETPKDILTGLEGYDKKFDEIVMSVVGTQNEQE